MEDYSYVGQGSIYLREYGAAAPLVDIGNCSALSFAPQEEKKKLPDYTLNGGGTRNSFSKLTGVEATFSFHDFSPENFARGLRGDITAITAATATDEQVVAYKGGFALLAKIPLVISEVRVAGSITVLDEGADYEVRDGGLYIPSTSSIVDPVGGAANIEVDYTYGAQNKLQALINANTNYELVFVGLNQARSGKRVRVQAYKVSHGLMQQLALLGEDYGVGEITAELLVDTTKTGAGVSKYFNVDIEA